MVTIGQQCTGPVGMWSVENPVDTSLELIKVYTLVENVKMKGKLWNMM